MPRITYEDARSMIQASDAELEKGLRDRRVLILNGTTLTRLSFTSWDYETDACVQENCAPSRARTSPPSSS